MQPDGKKSLTILGFLFGTPYTRFMYNKNSLDARIKKERNWIDKTQNNKGQA